MTSRNITNLVTAPAETAITLAEAKAHLRVDGSDDDTLITSLIGAATKYLDYPGALGKAIVTQTWDHSVRYVDGDGHIHLPVNPAISLTSISYYDENNSAQTATLGDFTLYKGEDWAYVAPNAGVSWPSTYVRPDAITVRYTAGYGAASAVPDSIKTAMLMLVAHFYEHRGDEQSGGIPETVHALVGIHKIGFIGA